MATMLGSRRGSWEVAANIFFLPCHSLQQWAPAWCSTGYPAEHLTYCVLSFCCVVITPAGSYCCGCVSTLPLYLVSQQYSCVTVLYMKLEVCLHTSRVKKKIHIANCFLACSTCLSSGDVCSHQAVRHHAKLSLQAPTILHTNYLMVKQALSYADRQSR